jgi:hypothetical protein
MARKTTHVNLRIASVAHYPSSSMEKGINKTARINSIVRAESRIELVQTNCNVEISARYIYLETNYEI